MSDHNMNKVHWKYTSIAILLIAIMAMLLFQAEDKLKISLLLLTGSLVLLRPLPFRQWTMLDGCLCLITAYDVVSCLYAACVIPAISYCLLSLFCLTAYFVLRKLFCSVQATRLLQLGSYLPIGAALLLAIPSFFVFRQSVLGVGFEDTYHFRFLFRPLGYITNVWAEVLLILLGWICVVRHYSSVFAFLTIWAIFLSFSRGAYIALGGYMVAWLLLVRPVREKLRLPAIGLLVGLLTFVCFPIEMKTTLQMNRTVSQQQSTEGRINAAQVGWEMFKERPLLGFGNGNYTFAVDRMLNQDSTRSYTSYAPNILIQLLIEKGIIGSLLYLIGMITVCHTIIKRREQPVSYTIGCLLLALMLKEMAQATLLGTPFSLFMIYTMLAFLQKEEFPEEKTEHKPVASGYLLPITTTVCYIGYIFLVFQQDQEETRLQQCTMAFEKGEHSLSIRLMEQNEEQTPNLINRGRLYTQYYLQTKETCYQEAAEKALLKAIRQQPEDVQICYLLANLYVESGQLEKAHRVTEELANNHPRNSLYLSLLSDILYQQGEKRAALQSLVNAIRYMPRLLTGKRIRDLQQNDPVFFQTLQQQLAALSVSPTDGPADYAHLGYIIRWCGNQPVAEKHLRKAIEELPNLATPWHLLGDDHKYRLLSYGAFQKDLLSIELPEEKEMSDEFLFETSYQAKFKNWYGCHLVTWYTDKDVR